MEWDWLTGLYQYIPAGGWGLALILIVAVVWALARGHLVGGAEHKRTLADCRYYRAAAERHDERADTAVVTVGKLADAQVQLATSQAEMARQVGNLSAQVGQMTELVRSGRWNGSGRR